MASSPRRPSHHGETACLQVGPLQFPRPRFKAEDTIAKKAPALCFVGAEKGSARVESCARVSACCAARASPPAGGVTVVAVESAPALPNGWAGGSRAAIFLSGPGVEALMSSFPSWFRKSVKKSVTSVVPYSIARPSHSGLSQTQDRPAATCGFERGRNKTDAIGRSHSRQPYEWVPAGAVPPLQVRFPARNTRIPLAAPSAQEI